MNDVHPRYAKMKFPPYSFTEYPKWVTTAEGKNKLVANRAEEIRLATNEGIALSADQQKEADYLAVLKEQQEAMEAMKAKIEALEAAAKPAETVTVSKDLPKAPAESAKPTVPFKT